MNTGAYMLIMFLDKDRKIKIGVNGPIKFKKGFYIYVGSAMKNLRQRIERHLSDDKKIHWHIDYFLKYAKIVDVIAFETSERIECKLAKNIEKQADATLIGFGSSDCKCAGHLFYFKVLIP